MFPFQSTHPLRGGTVLFILHLSIHLVFQSTHPLRGGTALRRGGKAGGADFNPPTPCGVGHLKIKRHEITVRFQSTHPLRGGTPLIALVQEQETNFNPPTPCGVGPMSLDMISTIINFNPPTPCGVGQQKHTGKFLLFYAEPIESMGFNKYTSVFRFYKAFLPSFSPKIAVRTPRLYAGHFPFARLNKQHPFGFI